MKILFTIAGLQPEFGGPAQSVPALAAALARQQVAVELITCESSPGQSPPVLPPRELVRTHLVSPAARSSQWRAGRNAFTVCLRGQGLESAHCVIHDHGLWLPNNHAVAETAHRLGIPRVVSPRGMLTAWALDHRGWKKKIGWWLYQRRDLQAAQVLHATSRNEAAAFRAAGLTMPIAIIPNGVELPSLEDGRWKMENGGADTQSLQSSISDLQSSRGTRTALFLGRIHPIKGLLDLVKAWAIISGQWSAVSGQSRVVAPQWRVIIAGRDEGGHAEELKAEIRKLKIQSDFEFVGPLDGKAKWELYRSADLFVLPSHSENFGIVVAEALACGVPVIATQGTPWKDLVEHRCGWWVDNNSKSLAAALREATQCSDEVRHEMGIRGRRLVEEKFSWPGIATQMLSVYQWMIGTGPKPSCVTD